MSKSVPDLYPTRIPGPSRWQERLDPVVHVTDSSGAPISKERVEAFDRDGYLVFPGMYDLREVQLFLKEAQRIREDPRIAASEKTVLEPQGRVVRSVFDIHRDNPLFSSLSEDLRIAGIARFLLGGDVYIHQSRLNFKPGFNGKEFYWHSDFETWHAEDGMPRMRALSCSVLLTENTQANGPLMVMPGSHRQFIPCVGETPENHYRESLRKQEYGVPDHESLEILANRHGIVPVTGPPGTVIFFDCNLMHGSNSNITPLPRTNLFFVFNQVDNAVNDGLRKQSPRPDFIAERKEFRPLSVRSHVFT